MKNSLTLLPSIENPLYLDYPLPFLQENLDAIFHDFFKNPDSPISLSPPPLPLQIGGEDHTDYATLHN